MILVAGSANLDFVVRAARIPAPGETVLGRDFATFPGGKGANPAIACATPAWRRPSCARQANPPAPRSRASACRA